MTNSITQNHVLEVINETHYARENCLDLEKNEINKSFLSLNGYFILPIIKKSLIKFKGKRVQILLLHSGIVVIF